MYDICRDASVGIAWKHTKEEEKRGKREKEDKKHLPVQFSTVSYPQNRHHTRYDRLEEKSTSTPPDPTRSDPRQIKNHKKM